MDNVDLKDLIIEEMAGVGFDMSKAGMAALFATAIANAVVKHIKDDASVIIKDGSSAGTYNVV